MNAPRKRSRLIAATAGSIDAPRKAQRVVLASQRAKTATPTEANSRRALVRLVREAAAKLGVRVELLGEGWVLKLTRGRQGSRDHAVRFVHGYGFDLNPAAVHLVCCDKAATGEVLTRAGVRCVPHELFLHPDFAKFVPHAGNWRRMLALWRTHGRDAVLKDNHGTGGRGVYRCTSELQLEEAALKLFARGNAIALSPFLTINREVRFIMLRGERVCAYEKLRAQVKGDGVSTMLALAQKQLGLRGRKLSSLLASLDDAERAALTSVPAKNATATLHWRHNLGQGAAAKLLSDREQDSRAQRIALQAAEALGLVFGSVDVVQSRAGWSVIEVNSGVMMEFLTAASAEGEAIARAVYAKALAAMFEA